MVEKIVSHTPPRHMDDWLAISMLATLYPNAEISYVHPQSKDLPALAENPNIILVDVGMVYNPELNNFDHHHDKNVPSSLVLVIEKFFKDIQTDSVFIKEIDIVDRFGPTAAGLTAVSSEALNLRKLILMSEPSKEAGEIAIQTIKSLPSTATQEEFINALYSSLDKNNLLEEAKEKLRKEEEDYKNKSSNVNIVEIEGFKVAISDKSLSPFHGRFFSEKDVDVIVERNSMNASQTSIISNSTKTQNKEEIIKFADRLAEDYNITFRHATGFIRVVDAPVEEVSINLLSRNSGPTP